MSVPPAGPPRLLDRADGLLLGVRPDAVRTDAEETLPPGSTVVLYTDGLVERRDADLDAGLARLHDAAADLSGRPADDVCDALLSRLAPDRSDDVALLALRVLHTGDRPRGNPSPDATRGVRVPAVPEPNGAVPPWPSAT